jgi:hypothetical protein
MSIAMESQGFDPSAVGIRLKSHYGIGQPSSSPQTQLNLELDNIIANAKANSDKTRGAAQKWLKKAIPHARQMGVRLELPFVFGSPMAILFRKCIKKLSEADPSYHIQVSWTEKLDGQYPKTTFGKRPFFGVPPQKIRRGQRGPR